MMPIARTSALIIAAVGIVSAAHNADPPRSATARTVVIAELFTSEGCSSCPPADDLLRQLVATQPVPGVDIVALGSHVDYWDRLGWRDPFSSALFSQRQTSYDEKVFHTNGIYTPQLVVDGAFEAVGSNAAAVRRAIERAAAVPRAVVEVSAQSSGGEDVRVDIVVKVPANVRRQGVADIMVAVTEDGLVSRVQRGENGGRTLTHSAVVWSLTTVGELAASTTASTASTVVTRAAAWKADQVHFVGFAQERAGRRILGGGSARLVRDP